MNKLRKIICSVLVLSSMILSFGLGSTDVKASENVKTTHGENIDDMTGLLKADYVYNNFKDSIAFMENEQYKTIVDVYSSPINMSIYLEYDPLNTEESWNKMSKLDRYIYFKSYILPYQDIMRKEWENKNEFLGELSVDKQMLVGTDVLAGVENGQLVYTALVDLWSWHYDYWEMTGEFYNFYSYYEGVTENSPVISEENMEPVEELDENYNVIEKEEFSISVWLKEHIITVILIVTVIVSLIVVMLRKKKENY